MLRRLKMWYVAIQKKKEHYREEQLLKIRDESLFMKRLYQLVKEGYSLHDALFLVVPHHVRDQERLADRLNDQFKAGSSAYELFQSLHLKYVNLLPLITSNVTSDLLIALKQMSEATDQKLTLEKSFRKVLIYPLILITFFLMILFAYRTFFLPRMKSIYQSEQVHLTISERWMTVALTYLPDVVLVMSILLFIAGYHFYRHHIQKVSSERSLYYRFVLTRKMIQIYATRHFSIEFGRLLETHITASEALVILKEQNYNLYVQHIAHLVYEEIAQGARLEEALQFNPYLLQEIATFVEHGSMRGFVGRELLLFGKVVNETFVHRIELLITLFQPLVFIVIACAIVATYLSILLPMYRLIGAF